MNISKIMQCTTNTIKKLKNTHVSDGTKVAVFAAVAGLGIMVAPDLLYLTNKNNVDSTTKKLLQEREALDDSIKNREEPVDSIIA